MNNTIEYSLPEKKPADFHLLYGNSYLVEIGWNYDLIERIGESKLLKDPGASVIRDVPLFSSIINTLEKLGILFIDDKFLRQEIKKKDGMRQYLIQFHFYHWLYDGVACLDSIACLLNERYKIGEPEKVKLNESFVRKIKTKDEKIANVIEPELVWINKIRKEMRNLIMHREGRSITGGGNNEPAFAIDLLRVLDRNILLNRISIVDTIDIYTPKIEDLTNTTLEHLFPE